MATLAAESTLVDSPVPHEVAAQALRDAVMIELPTDSEVAALSRAHDVGARTRHH